MTLDDQERRDQGLGIRRRVLGEDYVDTALARTSTVTAAFQDYLTRTAWGEIWSRPGLETKTRSLLTIALLAALSHDHELALHIRAGVLHNGVTPEEVGEVILHASVYAGVPAANRAMAVAQDVLGELGYPQAAPGTGR